MPGAIIGALAGWAFSGSIIAAGLATSILGAVMIGASIGSLFDTPDLDLGSTTPNYSFGPISNTKSQLLPIPIVYGKCRVAGNIFLQQFDTDERKVMNMMVGVSAGKISKIISVAADEHILYDEAMNTYTYWLWKMTRTHEEGFYSTVGDWEQSDYATYLAYNGRKEIHDINGNVVTVKILEGCSCNVYTGTATQNPDSREPDGNAYPNLAYVALTLTAQEGLSGNPVITSILEGKEIWTPSGTKFSRNPAWIVYDLLTNTLDGVGIPAEHIDLDSFVAAANYCDELVDGEPRYTLDYIIDTQRAAIDHLAAMLACFGGYFIPRDKIELHIEKPGSVYKALDPDNFVKGSFSWWQKSNDDSPNRITIEWIDPDNHYEQTAAVFEWTEDIQARGLYEKSISLLGITRSAQVGRMGKYMIETAKNVQNFCSFAVSLQDADIEAGEIISLTYPDFTAWSDKPFRVLSVQDDGQSGNIMVTCAEYVGTLYDDTQMAVAVPVNPNPTVTTDDIYNLILEDIGAFNADATWVPVIKASWQNPSDYTPKEINVRYRYQGTEAWTLVLNTTSTLTSANLTGLKTGENTEVWVNCKRPNGTNTQGDVAVIVVGADTTAPSAPTSLTAEGWFGNINLEWANPTDPDLSHIEIWESSTDDRDTAVKIAEVTGSSYQRHLGSFVVRYYWAKAVDTTGNVSGFNALAGTAGNSDQENHQDFVDLVLQENPYLAEVQSDLNSAITLGDTTIKTIDLPAYEQRLADRIDEVNDDIMTQVNTYADGTIDAMLDASEAISAVRDAGIITDPATGLTSIFALDAYKTANDARVSTVEVDLDAVESTLTSKVTLAQVDARIAGAVFGDPTELLLSGMDARIVTVEEGLDAVEGTLIEKASVVDVNALGGRVGTAESRLDGHDSEIALLATSQELDAVESRVSIAEVNIDALEGSIVNKVVSTVTVTQDEEELIAQGLVDAMLNDQEGKAETQEKSRTALAIAESELYAHIDDGLNAEAGERTLLAAQVAGNTSAIHTESATRASADSAMASQITTLVSAVSGNTSGIQTEATTRANADDALSSAISTVSATANAKNKTYRQVSAPTSGMTAGDLWFDSDDSNKPYRYSGSAWVATEDTRIATNTAAIQSEATARANADSAIASEVSTLSTTVGENTSAIQTVNSSVNGIKSKHAVKIDTNGYVTGYELIGTGASSSMVFHVDNFLIGKPGASNDYPFALGVVDGVTRISMQNVFIQDAAIDTLKIKNNAVTTYVFVTGGQTSSWRTLYGTGSPTWRTMPFNNSVTVTQIVSGRPAMITFSVNWYSAEDYAGTSFRVLANTSNTLTGASAIWTKNVGGGDQINMSYTEQFQWIPSSSGTWYLYLQWLLGSGGDMDSKWNTYIRSHSLSLFHMKR